MAGRELPDFNIEVSVIVDVAIWPQWTRPASFFMWMTSFDTARLSTFQQIRCFLAEHSIFQTVT
jgi:hypothetical protein